MGEGQMMDEIKDSCLQDSIKMHEELQDTEATPRCGLNIGKLFSDVINDNKVKINTMV